MDTEKNPKMPVEEPDESKPFAEARKDYEEILKEIRPFTRRSVSRVVTTEGQWLNTNNFCKK